MKQPLHWRQIKILLTVVAILNLILLFGFNYHLPTVPNAASEYKSVYLSKDDASNISETSAETEDQTLSPPKGYTAPSIKLGSDLPAISQEDLTQIPQVLQDLDLLSAEDGTGKDISSDISCSYSHLQDKTFEVTFQVINDYGDRAEKKVPMTFNLTKPIVILKQDRVSVSSEDDFDPKEFVESATDVDGTDLMKHVVTSGNVNLKKAGSYDIEYSVTSQENRSLGTAKLTVTVK